MKRKTLRKYLEKEWKIAGKSLKAIAASGDPEALHCFRVQVKKLNAFISLSENAGGPGCLQKYFKPVKKIFRKAGKIRDAQLRIGLGERQHAGKSFLDQEKRALKANIRSFSAQQEKYQHRVARSRRKIMRKVKSLPGKDIRNFFENQLQWIVANINQPEGLHNCRKHIKAIIYNDTWAHHALKKPLNRGYLKKLEKAIGDWHDQLLASRLFPALHAREKVLREKIDKLALDFYNQATAST